MRSNRILLFCLGVAALAGCSEQEITSANLPPNGAVRFISEAININTFNYLGSAHGNDVVAEF